METVVKTFNELSAYELFEIIKARIEVFVVEQNCPYRELDDTDKVSTHVYFKENGSIAAYIRVIPPGVKFSEASLGRIFTALPYRGNGLGAQILAKGIETAEKMFGKRAIRIEAQKYAQGFYEKAGFIRDSDEFDEDGIIHIEMIRNI
jgi:ElaA protein